MYLRYFGLKQPPFSIAPDPRYLFMSERHREALAHLLYGVRGGGGFVVLTGEIGAGKTTVCRCLLEQIPKRCNVAYIFNPKLTVDELLKSVCVEFRVSYPSAGPGAATVKDYVDALNEYLLKTHAVGQSNLLIIDEAQNLAADVLEQLRLLTNLETNERKLLQVVLIGQPELRALLARPQMEQLAQRVIARYHLGPLSEAETAHYVEHRLAVAGMTRAPLFERSALRSIYRYSCGVPRRINLLCDRALLGAYANGSAGVDRRIVERSAREVLGHHAVAARRRARFERPIMLAAGLAAGVALAGGVAWALRGGGEQRQVVAAAAESTSALAVQPALAGVVSESAARDEPAIFDLATGWTSLDGAGTESWRELARAWNVAAGDNDPCVAARSQQVHCFRSPNSTLALIRQLDRPGVLTLRDGNNRSAYALLTGLSGQSATLRIGGRARTVSLVSLADHWRGEFATLWRVPPNYVGTIGAASSGPAARWLALQLATARGDARPLAPRFDEAALRGWIHSFQLIQGLPSDGVAGPVTLMQLNRVLEIDEPRLDKERGK